MTKAPATAFVVGSLNADLVLQVPLLPVAGETLLVTAVGRLVGGKGANQAIAMARLGVDVAMVGCIGDDADGAALRAGLTSAGVRTEGVVTSPDRPSGLAVITVDDAGRNCICVVQGANQDVSAIAVQESVRAARPDVVITQLEIPEHVALAAMRAGREADSLTILNAAPAHPLVARMLEHVDVLVVNETEAAALAGSGSDAGIAFGTREAARIAVRLLELGPRLVVVTLGADGCLAATIDGVSWVAAMVAKVVDTTGAGDCFVAALATALVEGRANDEAARFATAAAGIAVTRRGAQQGMPIRAEVDGAYAYVSDAVGLPQEEPALHEQEPAKEL